MRTYRKKDWLDPAENIYLKKNVSQTDEPLHTHEFVELVYVLAGRGVHIVNGAAYAVSRGSLIFIGAGQTHAFSISAPMTYVNLLLNPAFLSREFLDAENVRALFALCVLDEFDDEIEGGAPIISFQAEELVEVEHLIDAMLREYTQKRIGYISALNGYIRVLFTAILRQMQSPARAHILHDIDRITPQLISYIEENLSNRLTLAELSARCFYTPTYFSRIFRECFGIPVTAYIKKRRMEKAMSLLRETDCTVDEIMHTVGYSDKKLFYRHFRELAAATPSCYRAQARQAKPKS